MRNRRRFLSAAVLAAPLAGSRHAAAQAPQREGGRLFAVEFRTGPNWDTSKKPNEQAHFREHSANLKRLRDQGHILVGARYSDKGFLVIAAESEPNVRALLETDPSIQNQVFAYEVHPFYVFYPGCVEAPKRPT